MSVCFDFSLNVKIDVHCVLVIVLNCFTVLNVSFYRTNLQPTPGGLLEDSIGSVEEIKRSVISCNNNEFLSCEVGGKKLGRFKDSYKSKLCRDGHRSFLNQFTR